MHQHVGRIVRAMPSSEVAVAQKIGHIAQCCQPEVRAAAASAQRTSRVQRDMGQESRLPQQEIVGSQIRHITCARRSAIDQYGSSPELPDIDRRTPPYIHYELMQFLRFRRLAYCHCFLKAINQMQGVSHRAIANRPVKCSKNAASAVSRPSCCHDRLDAPAMRNQSPGAVLFARVRYRQQHGQHQQHQRELQEQSGDDGDGQRLLHGRTGANTQRERQ